MKRQVLLGLVVMLICFFIGGSYIIYAIGDATNQLERAVTLHQAHDSMGELQRGIERVQRELNLKNSPTISQLALIQADIASLKKHIGSCPHCDYSTGILAQLDQLLILNENYTGQISQLLKLSPSSVEYQNLTGEIFRKGTDFRLAVESFIKNISEEFPSRSKTLYQDITRVRHLIIFLVIVGPIAILFLTAYFLKRFTGSVDALVEASSMLEKGDLDYRIDKNLKYEFKQLADSFNSMSYSLQLQQDDLQAARKLYQTLFESAGDGILILDLAEGREGQIISANPAAAAMHDYRVDELSGMNIVDLSCDGECPERLQCALEGNWMHYVVERKKKNGAMFLAEVSVGLLDLSEKNMLWLLAATLPKRKRKKPSCSEPTRWCWWVKWLLD